MSDITTLLQQRAELDAQIAVERQALREQHVSTIRGLMQTAGLTAADLASAKRRMVGVSRVAPKYRHPQTGSTWSGRGLKPTWLSTAITAGATLDQFLIGS